MNLLFPTTEELAARVNLEGPGAMEVMTAAQRVRLEYALVLRGLASALRADPSGLTATQLYSTLESVLEQRVTMLVMRETAQRTAEEYDRGYRDGWHDSGVVGGGRSSDGQPNPDVRTTISAMRGLLGRLLRHELRTKGE
jgi:hypothetical protein